MRKNMSARILIGTTLLCCWQIGAAYSADTTEEAAKVSSEVQAESDTATDSGWNGSSSGTSSRTCCDSSLTGFHIGVSAGADRLGCRFTTDKDKATEKDSDEKKKKSESGFVGGMFAGYDYQIGTLFLGADVVANLRTPEVKVGKDSKHPELHVKRSGGVGLKTRIGAAFGNFRTYACVGFDASRYKIKNLGVDQKDKDASKKASKVVPNLGIGIEYGFGSAFVGLECSGAFRKSIKKIDETSIKANSRVISARVGYKF
jgi:hypothetical protein